MNHEHNKQIKSNLLVVSADLPYIGGCGTNSYNILKQLSKIKSRYRTFGVFITNIDGNENPDNLENIFKVNINSDIEKNLSVIKNNINNDFGEIDLILIKNYKSFVFVNRVFKDEEKLFLPSGLRCFTSKIDEGFNYQELYGRKYNALDFEFDINIVDNGNIYENVIKYDCYLEKYVYEKANNIVTNSNITSNILHLSGIKNIDFIDLTYINHESKYFTHNLNIFREKPVKINEKVLDLINFSKNDLLDDE